MLFGPKNPDFPTYKLLCRIATGIGLEDSFCFTETQFRIQSRTMAGQFSAHIWTSVVAGFIISFPYVLYEFWKFISPGLKDNERSTSRGFILVASFLFFLGVLFGYYVVTPLSINFLGSYRVSDQVFNDFDLSNHYVRPIEPQEIFTQKQLEVINTNYPIFDLAYFPTERGPYNYNPDLTSQGQLKDPQNNWGGVTTAIKSEVDFDKSNIEYIEF